jgi:hypothetical protein
MAKSKKDKGAAPSAPKQTLEGLSDDQRYSLTEQHRLKVEKALATKKAAAAAYLNACKIAKAELGADGMDDINDLIALSTPEGEARMKAQIERQMRVMQWMNVPIGTHGELFADADRTPITERAFADGKRQGLAGEPQSNPHHHTTEAHRAHNDGYANGQTTKATKGFSKLEPESGGDTRREFVDKTRTETQAVEQAIKSGTVHQLGDKAKAAAAADSLAAH